MYSARAILQANGSAKGACRNLFGRVDHERLKMDYKTAISDTLEKAKKKWNFDFLNEIPLEGDYIWEKVESLNTDFPDTDRASNANMRQEENEVRSGCKRKQTLITDYFPKRYCTPPPSSSQCNP